MTTTHNNVTVYDDNDINRDRHYDAMPGDIIRSMGGRAHVVSSVEEYDHPWREEFRRPARIIRCEDGYAITAFGPTDSDTDDSITALGFSVIDRMTRP